jgi:hypothetical protein
MDMMKLPTQCISSTDATGTGVMSAFRIVMMPDLLRLNGIMQFWMLDTILKLRGSTTLEHGIMKILKSESPIIWVYTIHTVEFVLRC